MLNQLLSIGWSGLNAANAWINVTGNNLANTDTEGYCRQYVDQRDAISLTAKPGALGMGVSVQQVLRFFDAFLERSYVNQHTTSSRWNEHDKIMITLENLFNEANREGISSAMDKFFKAWQDLALRPDDTATRASLLSFADNLSDMVRSTMDGIKKVQREMDISIRDSVKRVNEIAQEIAGLNQQITVHTVKGVSNPNNLLDRRDQLVRELASLVDVEVRESEAGDWKVQLTTGQPLVQGVNTWELRVMGPQAEYRPQLPPSSGAAYTGAVDFVGADDHEYTVEIVSGGNVIPGTTSPAGQPQFRVSLDGGKTWLRDADGDEIHYSVTDLDGNGTTDPVLVKDLKISFTSNQNFNVGDKFDIVPKDALYWIEPTRGPENITPQIYFDGTDNNNRVTGGKIAAYYNIRDDNCGRYIDELDAVMTSLVWEINRVHSQGTGISLLNDAQGQQRVEAVDQPLGSWQALLPFSYRLQEGNVNFHIYDKVHGDYVNGGMLDFDFSQPGVQNFNPAVHTLEDVAQAINNGLVDQNGLPLAFTDSSGNPVNPLTAKILDNKLVIEAHPEFSLAMGTDSSGLLAALGLNAFLTGDSAASLAVNSRLRTNLDLVASHQVNGQSQTNTGDPVTAANIGKLADKAVTVYTFWKTTKDLTLGEYYANEVSTVGADRRLSKTRAEYNTALSDNLLEQVTGVTGVNMDEEMAKLIKFQHSYTAAAKLITTADQMLQTLLGLKQ
ncbi:MAG: flagellar hook-associated protein FlgK [Desulfovibrio sp.]|jgi:flagellar hook-associated protein 1 FlgK|nr:flagellar hook-associated protein FlgK [Desulfovibrio sp.]